MTSSLSLLIVTGLAYEARIIAGPDHATVCSGGSPDHLRHVLRCLTPIYRAVVSFGIAGGLDAGLAPGDAVLARGIIAGTSRWASHPGLVQAWARCLSAGGRNMIEADIVGSEAPVLTPRAKAALHAATGAAAVDMESHVAAEFAATRGVPFAAVRVICDAANHALPPFVGEAMDANGILNWRHVLRMVVRQPRQIALLPHLAHDASAAFAGLRHCRTLLGPTLGVSKLTELLSDIS